MPPRRRATNIDGLTKVEGVWPEVFTGLANPDRIRKGEKVEIDTLAAVDLIASGSCKRVG